MPAKKTAESSSDVEFASLDDLVSKPAATETVTLLLPVSGEEEPVPRKLRFKALPAEEYDSLLAAFPPTKEQKLKGFSFNWDKFAPALIAACLDKPQMSVADAKSMLSSSNWSGGEIGNLFGIAQSLCIAGFDVPKSESDSGTTTS